MPTEEKDSTKPFGSKKIMADERIPDIVSNPRDSMNVEKLIRGFKLNIACLFLLMRPKIIINIIVEEDVIRNTSWVDTANDNNPATMNISDDKTMSFLVSL